MRWSSPKTVALLGTIFLIPWDLFMGFGYTFSFKDNEPLWVLLFVWTTFYLTVPSVLVSWVFPRLGGFWILVNVGISILVEMIQEVVRFASYFHNPYPLANPLPIAIFLSVVTPLMYFWAGKLVFGWCILHVSGGEKTKGPPEQSELWIQ